MSDGQGALSKAAGKIESGSYGTSIALNGGSEYNQLHILSENILPNHNYESSMHLDGTAGKKSLYNTLNKYAGDLQIELHYDGCLSLLVCALGMSNQDKSPVDAGDGAYSHYIEPSNDLSTRAFNYYEEIALSNTARRRMSLCFEKQVSIHENASCMFNSFTLDVKPDRVTLTLNASAYSQGKDTATNGASTNWALPTATQLLFENFTVYLKARDSFTIGSGNKVLIVDESGNVTITLAEGTYTGGELAEELASKLNASALTGTYRVEYHEETRRFKVFTIDAVAFNIEGSHVTTTIENVIGFPADTGSGNYHQSQVDARPNAYAAFGAGDQVGISSLNLTYNNGLTTEDQDSESSNKIIEPERNEFRSVAGTIEIPRYRNDVFLDAANQNTTYEMLLKFTGSLIGGSNYEEFNVYIPSIKFDTAGAPISGANVLKQTLSFMASHAKFLDTANYFPVEYFVNENFFSSAGAISAFGIHTDGLYFGISTGLKRFTKEVGIEAVTTVTGAIASIQQYGNSLFIGQASGYVHEYVGGSASLSCDVGTGAVVSIKQYGDDLYVLEQTTGRITKYDGTSWSLSCDTTLITAKDMIVFDGKLWVYGSDGTNIDIYNYDGTTWAAADTDINVDANANGGFAIYGGRLYVATVDLIFVWNGSAFVEVADIGTAEIYGIFCWKGELFTYDSDKKLRIINLAAGTSTVLTTFTEYVVAKPIIYEGNVFLGDQASSCVFLKDVQEIFLVIQNQTSANPL